MSLTTTICQLRGGTPFMFDVMDRPDAVRALAEAVLEIPNLKMIQLSPDPNGPDFETVLAACRRIVEAGRKVCFQIGFDENLLRQIFAILPPEACLFYFGYARDVRACEEMLGTIRRLTERQRT